MLILDSEATALVEPLAKPLAQQPFLMELGILKVDDHTLEAIAPMHIWRCKPPVPIPPEVTKITGLTAADLGEKSFAAILPEIADVFLGERMAVAHNAAYDFGVLWAELSRLNRVTRFPWPQTQICTVERTQHLFGKYAKLTELHQYLFNETPQQEHRAGSDVELLVKCVRELWKRDLLP